MLLAVVIAVALVAAGDIWQLWRRDYFWRDPLAGATVHRLTDFAGEETDAAISPNGKFLTFLSDRDERFDAWIAGSTPAATNITNGRFQMLNNPNARMVGFSADGAQVWFEQQVSARPLVWTSWIRPLLGGTPRRFVEGGLEPTWSPDGNSLSITPTISAIPCSWRTRTAATRERFSSEHPECMATIRRGRRMGTSCIWNGYHWNG